SFPRLRCPRRLQSCPGPATSSRTRARAARGPARHLRQAWSAAGLPWCHLCALASGFSTLELFFLELLEGFGDADVLSPTSYGECGRRIGSSDPTTKRCMVNGLTRAERSTEPRRAARAAARERATREDFA